MQRTVLAFALTAIGISACGGSSPPPARQQEPTAADRDSALSELERRRAALGITQKGADPRSGRYAFYPLGIGGLLLDTSTGEMWRLNPVSDVLTPVSRYLSTDPNAGARVDPKDPLGIR